jgi:hypothetical protein
MQQIGSSLGLAILLTVFGTATRDAYPNQLARFLAGATPQERAHYEQTHQLPAQFANRVLTEGITSALKAAAIFGMVTLAVLLVVIRAPATASETMIVETAIAESDGA